MFEQFEIENGLIIGNRNSMEIKVEGMVSNIFTKCFRKVPNFSCGDIRQLFLRFY